jgi:NCS1 family nucleobase:cation symporter-1
MGTTIEEKVKWEVYRSRLPAFPGDRIFSGVDHTLVTTAWSIATWLFVMGAWQGFAAPLHLAIIATFFGCTVPLLFQSLLGKYHCRWGVDVAFGARATFGPLGTKILVLLFGIVPAWCWISIPAIMFGNAMSKILTAYGMTGVITNEFLWGVPCMALGLFFTYMGPDWVKWAMRLATPIMLVLIAIITWKMLTVWGWSNIAAIRPEGLNPNPYLSFIIAVEMAIGLGVSWLFQFACYGRICKSETGAYYGTYIGWGLLWALLAIPAMFVALVAGASDIIDGLALIGGGWVILYLGLLVLANPSSLATNGYLVALTLRNFFPKIPWVAAVGVNFIVLILVAIPWAYDSFASFVILIATFCMSIAAVWVLDVILRRFNVSITDLYDETRKGAYYYYKGINIWVIIAVAIGTIVSFLIWNPMTQEIHNEAIFSVLGGSIPGAAVAAAVYYIFYRLIILPRKLGLPAIPKA